MNEQRLADLESLCRLASTGPWKANKMGEIFAEPGTDQMAWIATTTPGMSYPTAAEIINARFIATARTALPELLAEVRRLRSQLENHPHAEEE